MKVKPHVLVTTCEMLASHAGRLNTAGRAPITVWTGGRVGAKTDLDIVIKIITPFVKPVASHSTVQFLRRGRYKHDESYIWTSPVTDLRH
jgi:hypothetical protein